MDRAPHCAHNVDPFEFIGTVLLKMGVFCTASSYGPGRAINIARVGIPGSLRVRMVVGDLALANHDMMRENSANRLMEANPLPPREP